jgi:hypothetical protein
VSVAKPPHGLRKSLPPSMSTDVFDDRIREDEVEMVSEQLRGWRAGVSDHR